MRRAPIVIGATAAGLAAVLSFRTPGLPPGPAQASQAPSTTSPTNAGSSMSQKSAGSTTTAPPPTTSPPPATTQPTAPATTTTEPKARSATGAAERYGYGVISVRVSVTGTQIVAVTVATLQTAETYSQQLATQVIPTLRREVLSAQSARIAAVSGATYTSEAYAASVQSALDALHA